MTYCVYKHTCPNGKVYIGITNQNPYRRWKNGYGCKGQSAFYQAIQKYGWNNIKHEIIFENLSLEEAAKKEKELIEKCKMFSYNTQNAGGICGVKIKQYSMTGKLLNVFESVTEAAKLTNTHTSRIVKVCQQKANSSNGFVWRYEYDDFLSKSLQEIINSIV